MTKWKERQDSGDGKHLQSFVQVLGREELHLAIIFDHYHDFTTTAYSEAILVTIICEEAEQQ
jgi:hypothetical protein